MARILLIEDDLDVCHVMEHALIDGGHAVEATGASRWPTEPERKASRPSSSRRMISTASSFC